ncbi:CapA family protein [Rhizobium leguminosarum]|uniref:CapA family protein n=1 Tax=Rhizobium leguminosarum TaxID=384 RepID=UPI001031F9C5|nr:CapA family protein [Rhizobium leguminosarum]TBF87919.1 CapA family protein [Rhizobium leguminosarum]TBG07100.1 CapA family protein [Rhizobium leguminosarum]TBG07573.1 CapA family protein [Rhizobium leguminosarum]TBG30784.1 CapA family protein [Rhizobium leguminosarum]TBG50025.1 CapA family protein [Rhizobium leguminosarum]
MSSPFTLAITGQSLIHHDVRQVQDGGFAAVKALIQRADIAFTNFETTVLGRHGGWPLKGSYFGCSAPVVLDALKDIGFNALALSNNHAFDLGPPGVLSTLEEVAERGFLHAGIGVDAADARRPGMKSFSTRQVALVAMDAGPGPATMYAADATDRRPARPGVNGLKVSRRFEIEPTAFASLTAIQDIFQSSSMERGNYAQPHDPPELRSADEIDFYGTIFSRSSKNRRQILVDEASLQGHLSTIRRAAAEGAFVIAYLHHHHWEPNWREVPAWVQSLAHACVDAGAAMFVSHGAPVLQPIEIYRGAPIFFGLGNFLFHLNEGETVWSSPDVWKSVVATCRFDASARLQSIDLHPVVIGGERLDAENYHERIVPIPAPKRMAMEMIEDLAARSQSHGVSIIVDGEHGAITSY